MTDGAIMAAHADGAILVVRHGKTAAIRSHPPSSALTAVDARLLGTVLNMMPIKGAEAYGYSGYGYDNQTTQHAGDPD